MVIDMAVNHENVKEKIISSDGKANC